MDQQKEKINSIKVKPPQKRRSKFTNRSSQKYDKKRKKFMHDNFGVDEKEHLKKMTKKERGKCVITSRKKKGGQQNKKAKRDNLDKNEKEQLRKYEKKGKKVMLDNLDDEKKNKEDKERKKDKRDYLGDNEK